MIAKTVREVSVLSTKLPPGHGRNALEINQVNLVENGFGGAQRGLT
jgi:hypothetical protein